MKTTIHYALSLAWLSVAIGAIITGNQILINLTYGLIGLGSSLSLVLMGLVLAVVIFAPERAEPPKKQVLHVWWIRFMNVAWLGLLVASGWWWCAAAAAAGIAATFVSVELLRQASAKKVE